MDRSKILLASLILSLGLTLTAAAQPRNETSLDPLTGQSFSSPPEPQTCTPWHTGCAAVPVGLDVKKDGAVSGGENWTQLGDGSWSYCTDKMCVMPKTCAEDPAMAPCKAAAAVKQASAAARDAAAQPPQDTLALKIFEAIKSASPSAGGAGPGAAEPARDIRESNGGKMVSALSDLIAGTSFGPELAAARSRSDLRPLYEGAANLRKVEDAAKGAAEPASEGRAGGTLFDGTDRRKPPTRKDLEPSRGVQIHYTK